MFSVSLGFATLLNQEHQTIVNSMTEAKQKVGLSSRLLQMKFMQKASEKAKLQAAQQRADENEENKQEQVQNEEEQTATNQDKPAPAGTSKCKIIYDRAPLPTGLPATGRLTFGKRPESEEPDASAKDVTDAAMAQSLQTSRKQQENGIKNKRPQQPYAHTTLREKRRKQK